MGYAIYWISKLTSWELFEEISKTCTNREQQPRARIVNVAQRYDIASLNADIANQEFSSRYKKVLFLTYPT